MRAITACCVHRNEPTAGALLRWARLGGVVETNHNFGGQVAVLVILRHRPRLTLFQQLCRRVGAARTVRGALAHLHHRRDARRLDQRDARRRVARRRQRRRQRRIRGVGGACARAGTIHGAGTVAAGELLDAARRHDHDRPAQVSYVGAAYCMHSMHSTHGGAASSSTRMPGGVWSALFHAAECHVHACRTVCPTGAGLLGWMAGMPETWTVPLSMNALNENPAIASHWRTTQQDPGAL